MIETIERPPRTRRKLGELDYDLELEAALIGTLGTEKAVKIGLARFHSSPAKGRLWKDGMAVRHRVLPDRQSVAAWLEYA